jgi:type I restriction enzyme S subunit
MRTGYKQTSLGEIPEEWEVVKLGDERYLEIVSGGTPSSKKKDYWS